MNADEKDGLYNIKLNNLLDEKYKQFQPLTPEECTEPIKEAYIPKVGDRFITPFGEYLNVIYVGGTHCILSRHSGSLTQEFKIFHDKMHEYIKSGILKKD